MMTETNTQADPAAPADAAPEAGSILFPNEGEGAPADPLAGDPPAGDPKPAEPEGWKPYEADPAKSDEENAAAKAEHDKGDPDAPANKVPEDGKYEFTRPEGVELDTKLAEALMPEFKDLGLTQGQAQKLVERYTEAMQSKVAAQAETFASMVDGWATEAKADKEIGGDKWDATISNSQRAVKALGTPELRDYLNTSGGGNHPELIRFMSKVGALIGEDVPAGGGEGGGKPADPAHILFPSDAPKG